MQRPVTRLQTFLTLLVLCVPAMAQARPAPSGGDVHIRYNALPASMLPAESLQQLGVGDAAHTGLVNILVTRGTSDAATGMAADVQARASTALGAAVRVSVREIRDDGGISYVGIFPLRQSGTLRFDIDVTPAGANTRHIHFEHDFVID